MSKSKINCTVFGCTNRYSNTAHLTPPVHFYRYPGNDVQRREKWVNFARRQNANGSRWEASKFSRTCSQHFIDNEKSNNPERPNYNPTVHPLSKPSEATTLNKKRYERLEFRRKCIQEVPRTHTTYYKDIVRLINAKKVTE